VYLIDLQSKPFKKELVTLSELLFFALVWALSTQNVVFGVRVVRVRVQEVEEVAMWFCG
jgi:hypothetical protein